MAIKIEEKVVAYSSITGEAIMPEYLWLNEDDVKRYLDKNKMPKDPNYSVEDIIHDLTSSSGMYTLDPLVKMETREYIAGLLENLAS